MIKTNKIIIKNHTKLHECIIYNYIYKLIRDKLIYDYIEEDYIDNIIEFGMRKYLIRYRKTDRNTKIYDISYFCEE